MNNANNANNGTVHITTRRGTAVGRPVARRTKTKVVLKDGREFATKSGRMLKVIGWDGARMVDPDVAEQLNRDAEKIRELNKNLREFRRASRDLIRTANNAGMVAAATEAVVRATP